MKSFLKKIVWFVMVVPIIYLAIVWKRLPEKIATHFDFQGNADRYDSKSGFLWFMMIMVVVSVGVYLLITNMYRIDPKKYASENKERLQKIAFAIVVFMSALGCIFIYTGISGSLKLNLRFFFALMGLFWAVIGNYMNNLKPNYFAGLRLPWTLESEDNWRRTHHLASKLWFATGLLVTVIAIFASTTVSIICMFTLLFFATVIPAVYSYRLYKKQKSARG
jgi:uncharacterized membrane protein